MNNFIEEYRKVNLFLIGVQKSGTTSLYNMLISHSCVLGGIRKEIGFFISKFLYKKGFLYYKYFFPKRNKHHKYLIDATPAYIYFPNCLERIYNYNRDSKIIILLRDPIERAISAYYFYKKFNLMKYEDKEKLYNRQFEMFNDEKEMEEFRNWLFMEKFWSFKEVIFNEFKMIKESKFSKIGIVSRGLYYQQLEKVFKYFKDENILILNYVDLVRNNNKLFNNLWNFLEIPQIEVDFLHLNKSSNYSLDDYIEEIEILKDFYYSDVLKVYRFIDFKFKNF